MKKNVILLAAAMLLMVGCKPKQEAESIIGRPSVSVGDGHFTPELMWKLGKMGEFDVSPDGASLSSPPITTWSRTKAMPNCM